jgi:hypothetical protein
MRTISGKTSSSMVFIRILVTGINQQLYQKRYFKVIIIR